MEYDVDNLSEDELTALKELVHEHSVFKTTLPDFRNYLMPFETLVSRGLAYVIEGCYEATEAGEGYLRTLEQDMSTEYEPSYSIERMWIDALELTPAFTDESMLNLIELAEPGIKILVVGDDPQHYDPLLDAGLIVKIGDENDWKQRYAITAAGRQYVAAHPFDVDAAVRRIAEAPVRPKVETLEAAREIIGELIDGIKAALALIDDDGKMSTYDVAVKYGVPVSQAVATLYETYLRTL